MTGLLASKPGLRKALASVLIVAALASAPAFETGAMALKVNWGAVVKDGAAILGGAVAVIFVPEITIPALIGASLSSGAGAFDLVFNRCSYGISRC